jgi:hypothetical protein
MEIDEFERGYPRRMRSEKPTTDFSDNRMRSNSGASPSGRMLNAHHFISSNMVSLNPDQLGR